MKSKTKRPSPVVVYPEKCTGCLICEMRCSFRFEKAVNPSRAAIIVRRIVGGANEFEISFNDLCDNCGNCARYCPYGALIQQKKEER